MKKHVHVAAALIFENGKIFATRRGDSPYPYVAHKLEFPGGKIEPNETGEEAVKRELLEELDMEVTVGGLFGKTTFEYPDFIITLSLYECVPHSSFTLKEHESYVWISPSKLDFDDFAPADIQLLEDIKRVFGA